MKTLTQHINEKLIINKEYKTPINKYIENIDSYQWANDHLGLIGNEDMFDNFYNWLTQKGKKISKNELMSLKNSSYLMAINKDEKAIILFVQSFGIKFCTIEIFCRAEANEDERLTFRCYDDCGAARIWPYDPNSSLLNGMECYKIDADLYEEVIDIFNEHWDR